MDNEKNNRDEFKISLQEAKSKLMDLKSFHKEMMKEGIDYGNLPNTSKKCLFKPGAEKLCSYYGLAIQFELMNHTEDYENGYFSFTIKVMLTNKCTGVIEAEGIGSCNSFETKYTKQDKYNVANTVLKMAKKRAFIDATLLATRSSDIFTQDLEDESAEHRKQFQNTQQEEQVPPQKNDGPAVSEKQLNYIYQLISQ